MSNFAGEKELAICYVEGGVASLSTSIQKFANRAKKLAKDYPTEVKLFNNSDGSVYIQFPAEWIKMPKPKRIVSEEQKQKAKERMNNIRRNKSEA